jgi:hypothetical protein
MQSLQRDPEEAKELLVQIRQNKQHEGESTPEESDKVKF